MKFVFYSKEEQEDFCEAFCPDIIGFKNTCTRSTKDGVCVKCWENAIECEVVESGR